MQIVYLSGNTGAGKSTTLRLLQKAFGRDRKVLAVDESTLHHPHLMKMFDDPERWAVTIQLNFLTQRAAVLLDSCDRKDVDLLIMERSLSEDYLFFERYVRLGHVPEKLLPAHRNFVEYLYTLLPAQQVHVFLNTSPDVCHGRLEEARLAGTRQVELPEKELRSYIGEMDELYRRWRSSVAFPVLDVDIASVQSEPVDVAERCARLLTAV